MPKRLIARVDVYDDGDKTYSAHVLPAANDSGIAFFDEPSVSSLFVRVVRAVVDITRGRPLSPWRHEPPSNDNGEKP